MKTVINIQSHVTVVKKHSYNSHPLRIHVDWSNYSDNEPNIM